MDIEVIFQHNVTINNFAYKMQFKVLIVLKLFVIKCMRLLGPYLRGQSWYHTKKLIISKINA